MDPRAPCPLACPPDPPLPWRRTAVGVAARGTRRSQRAYSRPPCRLRSPAARTLMAHALTGRSLGRWSQGNRWHSVVPGEAAGGRAERERGVRGRPCFAPERPTCSARCLAARSRGVGCRVSTWCYITDQHIRTATLLPLQTMYVEPALRQRLAT
jgi:hypothetical protein